jgi:putative hydrolase of the HAD superfamily
MMDAVFFDLYETLITEWRDGKKKADFGSPAKSLGIEEKQFKTEWSARRDQRMTGHFRDYQHVLEDICQVFGVTITTDALRDLCRERTRAKSVPFAEIEEGILNTLNQLKEMGIKIGLISNCSSEEITAWAASPLAPLFDDVIFSYEVKLAKPAPEIYALACNRMGCLPEHAAFVGDGGSDELAGAERYGLRPYHATWFVPEWISERITAYPKLRAPGELVDALS